MSRIEQLKAELAKALEPASVISAKAEAEARDFTAEERAVVSKAFDDAKGIRARYDTAKADADLIAGLGDLGDGIGLKAGGDTGSTPGDGAPTKPGKGASIGEQFVASAGYKGLMGRFPGGRIPDRAELKMDPVGYKALITGVSDTSAGALVDTDRLGIVEPGAFWRPLVLRDVITTGTTESDTVEYVRVTGYTNNADTVPEAVTAAAIGSADSSSTVDATEAGVKPESAMTLAKVTATVKTVAHWIPATRRALSDASQVRTLIDNFLRYGLEEELEDQIISGGGTGEDFEGLASVSGVQSQAFTDDVLTTTRKARTLVRTVGRAVPTAYVMNPADWETIDLLQDNEARYFFGGPSRLGQPTLWGLPVVESEAVAEGTAYVGDWRMAVLWDREQASITVSDSHADFFVRNLVAILAEMRAAFGVLRPKAFVSIDMAV